MNHSVHKLASIFKEMVKNRQTMDCQWKNIALGKEAFEYIAMLSPQDEHNFAE